jgi:hypothetical protein
LCSHLNRRVIRSETIAKADDYAAAKVAYYESARRSPIGPALLEIAKGQVSAVTQNRPLMVEIKGFKTSHFKESKIAPRDRKNLGLGGACRLSSKRFHDSTITISNLSFGRKSMAYSILGPTFDFLIGDPTDGEIAIECK